MIRQLLAVAAVGCSLAVAPSAAHAATAASCSDDLRLENGSCSVPVVAPAMTAAKALSTSAQSEQIAKLDSLLDSGSPITTSDLPLGVSLPFGAKKNASVNSLATTQTAAATSSLSSYQLASAANMTIKKEGQGNDKAYWTCGPAASRNVAMAVYDHKTGSYTDFGEAQWADWENTTKDGTSRANVASALSIHLGSWGSWQTTRPTDKSDLLSWVITDTVSYGRPTIMNVSTGALSFWNGKNLGHFDFVYGYDKTPSPNRLYFGEEWDPVFIYGSSSYGNPYGKHTDSVADGYAAVTNSSIHGIVG